MRDLGSTVYAGLSADEMELGLQVAGVGIGTVDYLADTVRLDPLSAKLFGLEPGEDIPREIFHAGIHPDDRDEVNASVDYLLADSRTNVVDLTHRTISENGDIHWVNARKRISFDHTTSPPRPVSGVFAVIDVTARKMAEMQSEMLIGELNHRTKNLIAVVAGISRSLRRHSRPEEFPERLQERLEALARNQDAVAKGDIRVFGLREIIRQQLSPFTVAQEGRSRVSGPEIALSSSSAHLVAMMLHELVTNAVKYGALSGTYGMVDVSWHLDGPEDDDLVLTWAETGGPVVARPDHQGFGTQVLTTLMRTSFGAEVDLNYAPEGFHMVLRVSVDRVTGMA